MFKDFEREKQLKESEQFLDELQEELEEKQIYEKQSLQEMSRLSTKKTTSDETMTILEEQYTHLSNLYEERLRREISEVEFQKKLNENGSFGLSVDRPDKYEFRQLVTSLVVISRYVRPRGQVPSYKHKDLLRTTP